MREECDDERDVGLYGTGILFEESNPTGSRPSDRYFSSDGILMFHVLQHVKHQNTAKRHNEVGEVEVTVTSGRHAQTEGANKQKKRQHPVEA